MKISLNAKKHVTGSLTLPAKFDPRQENRDAKVRDFFDLFRQVDQSKRFPKKVNNSKDFLILC